MIGQPFYSSSRPHVAEPEDRMIVDLEFRRFDHPLNVQPSTWSRIKSLVD